MTAADELALLAAIRAQPDDDAARLVYADYLEEDGYSPRAELIRLQCELSQRIVPWCGSYTKECVQSKNCPRCGNTTVPRRGVHFEHQRRCNRCDQSYDAEELAGCRKHILLARESALLNLHADGWRRGPVCGSFMGDECRLSQCERCHGTGDAGGLAAQPRVPENSWEPTEYPEVTYHRGMKRVRVPTLAECVKILCPKCRSAKYIDSRANACFVCQSTAVDAPSDWLAAVCRHHPDVVEVMCEDKEPAYYAYHDVYGKFVEYYCWRSDVEGGAHDVPRALKQYLGRNEFHTPDAAKLALSRAVVLWAHSPTP